MAHRRLGGGESIQLREGRIFFACQRAHGSIRGRSTPCRSAFFRGSLAGAGQEREPVWEPVLPAMRPAASLQVLSRQLLPRVRVNLEQIQRILGYRHRRPQRGDPMLRELQSAAAEISERLHAGTYQRL